VRKTNYPEIVEKIKAFYYKDLLSMSEVAKKLGVSIDSVVYLMRKNNLKRRSFTESNKIVFQNKPLSFSVKNNKTQKNRELEIAGLMLYWAEGYKSEKGASVDFANSDPRMIKVFISFLRSVYRLDENRLRVSLYCYSNQKISSLVDFWSELTNIPKNQFTKPYVRKDFRENGRVMKYGLVHIRYSDKKMLIDLMKKMSYYIESFMRRSDSGYSSGL
jgi:predicted DNA-binding protein YlxM (UPF0122 family)